MQKRLETCHGGTVNVGEVLNKSAFICDAVARLTRLWKRAGQKSSLVVERVAKVYTSCSN